MRKQELEELRRLEEELMATEYVPEGFDEIDLLDDTWQDVTDIPVEAYNGDVTDVDLDAYSKAVNQDAPRRSAAPIVLLVLLFCVVVFCAMKLLGVV